ncbi:MAG: sugar phosphate nucleotidyltransferase [Patescibacteria group bacterium]
MKAIIFAGGTGTRLWPLSRRKSPKQFERIVGNKSTLQLAVERLLPDFDHKDIYISSNSFYKKLIQKQLPQIPEKNFILEPFKKDTGPAIALSTGILSMNNPHEPIAILWSDHLVKNVELFKKMLRIAHKKIEKNPNKIIFISHKPRFPSVNLGYVNFGDEIDNLDGINFFKFLGWKYRPDEKLAKKFFQSSNYAWNLGYFVSSPKFIYESFKRYMPSIYKKTEIILSHLGKPDYEETLTKQYSGMESISFDNAILENLEKKEAEVIVEDIGWSDVGSWEALKEALQSLPSENITRGKVQLEDVKDSLVYNYDNGKLIVGVDLEENIIINTADVILIAKKNSMSKVKKLVENFAGTEYDKLT